MEMNVKRISKESLIIAETESECLATPYCEKSRLKNDYEINV